MKICSKCREEKSSDKFHANNSKADGLQAMCKLCRSLYVRNHYRANKNTYKKNIKRRQKEIKNYIHEKKSVPCSDCEIKYPSYVMEFDHLKNKKFNISGSHLSQGFFKIKEEIEKCDVVCANCHRERTAKSCGYSVIG